MPVGARLRWWVAVALVAVWPMAVPEPNDERGALWKEGCVDHEFMELVTCGTGKPLTLRVDSVISWGTPESYGMHSERLFAGCVGVMIMNGRTVAVHGTPAGFGDRFKGERSKWRICRYKLRQVEVQIEAERGRKQVSVSTGEDRQVEVNVGEP